MEEACDIQGRAGMRMTRLRGMLTKVLRRHQNHFPLLDHKKTLRTKRNKNQ